MSETHSDTEKYYSFAEWAVVKYKGARTPKYIQSWLHHEGLKRVKDGTRFFLEPEQSPISIPGNVEAIVPKVGVGRIKLKSAKVRAVAGMQKLSLPVLDQKTPAHLIGIASNMTREEGYIPIVEMTEFIPTVQSDPPEYWQLFLGMSRRDQMVFVPKTTFKRKRITIYWENVPDNEPHFSWDLSEEQLQSAIPVSPDESPEFDTQPDPMEVEGEGFSRDEGLRYLNLDGLPEDRWTIFESHHTFLVVGGVTFFVTNLLRGIERILDVGIEPEAEAKY